MNYVILFLQLFVAFGLLNVWLLRSNKETPYRGSDADSLKSEFIAYGLPMWFYYLTGFLKISSACLLLLGIWFPFLIFPAAALVSVLMIGALRMHSRAGDPLKKFIPALIMLFSSLALSLGSYQYVV